MRKIIDVHTHIGRDYKNAYSDYDVLKRMDENHIEYAVISPLTDYCAPEGVKSCMRENDNIAEMLTKHPDRFIKGMGVVNPRHGIAAVAEVGRIFNELNLSGLMFSNDKLGYSMDNPYMYAFIEEMPKEKKPVVLMHTSFFSVLEPPFMLGKLARRFHDVIFINASGMKDTTHSNCSRDLAATHENIFLDTACVHYILEPVKKAVSEVGGEKILFGSDIPLDEISYERMIVESSSVSEEVKEKIFFNNAAKIFGINI